MTTTDQSTASDSPAGAVTSDAEYVLWEDFHAGRGPKVICSRAALATVAPQHCEGYKARRIAIERGILWQILTGQKYKEN